MWGGSVKHGGMSHATYQYESQKRLPALALKRNEDPMTVRKGKEIRPEQVIPMDDDDFRDF